MFVANWKMKGSVRSLEKWLDVISSSQKSKNCIFCPPLVYLMEASKIIQENNLDLSLGSQDIDPDSALSLTGGISSSMLKEMRCKYVIIGHSERRIFYKESSELLLDKVSTCLEKNIKVIFCVGESLVDKNSGKTKEKLTKQLNILSNLSLENLIIAYEPVWAIGSGKTPTLEDISDISTYLTEELISLGQKVEDITILYGGSVDDSNAKEIYQLKSVSGLLVGGASLDEKKFLKIIG